MLASDLVTSKNLLVIIICMLCFHVGDLSLQHTSQVKQPTERDIENTRESAYERETPSPWCQTPLICPSPLHSSTPLCCELTHETGKGSSRHLTGLAWSLTFLIITQDSVRPWISRMRRNPRNKCVESDALPGFVLKSVSHNLQKHTSYQGQIARNTISTANNSGVHLPSICCLSGINN